MHFLSKLDKSSGIKGLLFSLRNPVWRSRSYAHHDEFHPGSSPAARCASHPGRQGAAARIYIIHSGNSTRRRRRRDEPAQNQPHPHRPRLMPVPGEKGPQIQSAKEENADERELGADLWGVGPVTTLLRREDDNNNYKKHNYY